MQFRYSISGKTGQCTGPDAESRLQAFIDSGKTRCPACDRDALDYVVPPVYDDGRPDTLMAFMDCSACDAEYRLEYSVSSLILDCSPSIDPSTTIGDHQSTGIDGWTDIDAAQAWTEGWCLCYVNGHLIIAGNDCGLFELDDHAHRYVTHRAVGPDAPDLYRKAIAILTRNPNRLETVNFGGSL